MSDNTVAISFGAVRWTTLAEKTAGGKVKCSEEIFSLNYLLFNNNFMYCKEAVLSHLNFSCEQRVADFVDKTLQRNTCPFA
jgi:hypothetical protein